MLKDLCSESAGRGLAGGSGGAESATQCRRRRQRRTEPDILSTRRTGACTGAGAGGARIERVERSSSDVGHDAAHRMFSARAGDGAGDGDGDAVKTVVCDEGTSVYLAVVLEYLTAELL